MGVLNILRKGGLFLETMRKLVVIGIVVFTLVAGSLAALAASQYSTPAEAVAGLTGRDLQSVIDERIGTGKTYGTIANEAGVLDEFRAEMLGIKKGRLAACLADGTLTQEQADAIIAKIESAQAGCGGSGKGCELHGAGLGFGFDHDQCLKQGSRGRSHKCHRIGSKSRSGQNSLSFLP